MSIGATSLNRLVPDYEPVFHIGDELYNPNVLELVRITQVGPQQIRTVTINGFTSGEYWNDTSWWIDQLANKKWSFTYRSLFTYPPALAVRATRTKCAKCGDDNPYAELPASGLCGSCRSYDAMGGFSE